MSAAAAGLLLAIETATDAPSLALGTPREPGDVIRLPGRRDLSRDIEAVVQRLLAGRGVPVSSLSGVVVADGPGSFTGLRIGIAFAKGLCRACGLPLLSGPSILGAAFAASGGEGTVLVEYDALRGDVYRAVYRFAGRSGPTSPGSPEPEGRAPATDAGSFEVLAAPELVPRSVPPRGYGDLVRADAASASAAALLSLGRLDGGLQAIDPPDGWEPAYGRLAEAEVRHRAGQR